MRARTDKHGTIAFTLPISCQICLGKVCNTFIILHFFIFSYKNILLALCQSDQSVASSVSREADKVSQIYTFFTVHRFVQKHYW